MAEPKKRGRPQTREPEPGDRVPLSLRVTPEMKLRLEMAATHSGRSQSQEAEFRLERSFDREDLLPQVLTLAYGPKIAGVVLAIATAMFAAGKWTLGRSSFVQDDRWLKDPDQYDQAMQAVIGVLEGLRPPGNPTDAQREGTIGEQFAERLLAAIRNEPPADYDPDSVGNNGITDDFIFGGQQIMALRSLLANFLNRSDG